MFFAAVRVVFIRNKGVITDSQWEKGFGAFWIASIEKSGLFGEIPHFVGISEGRAPMTPRYVLWRSDLYADGKEYGREKDIF